jgi:hypothetical protein
MARKRALKRARTNPRFRTDEEAAEFFDTHDTSELLDTLPEVGPIIDGRKPLQPISLRLPAETILAAKRVARRKGVGYQVLLRMWITERLNQERRRAS